MPQWTDINNITAAVETLQFITSPGYYISLFHPLVENDKWLETQISPREWSLTIQPSSALVFENNRVKIDYARLAADGTSISVNPAIAADYFVGDNIYFTSSQWFTDAGIPAGVTMKFSQALSTNKVAITGIGGYQDKLGYLFDKFTTINYEPTTPIWSIDGWGIAYDETKPLMTVVPRLIDNKIAMGVDAAKWGWHLTGGLYEARSNPYNLTPEYQGVHSFFWNTPETFPTEPIWLEFYEDRDSVLHRLYAQFDDDAMKKLMKSMKLWFGDITFKHYTAKFGNLSAIQNGKVPVILERDKFRFKMSVDIPSPVIQAQGMVSLNAESDGMFIPVSKGGLFEDQYNIVNTYTLTREIGDWIIDSVNPAPGGIINGRIFSNGGMVNFEEILGSHIPRWFLSRLSILLTDNNSSYAGAVKQYLAPGEYQFKIEVTANA